MLLHDTITISNNNNYMMVYINNNYCVWISLLQIYNH